MQGALPLYLSISLLGPFQLRGKGFTLLLPDSLLISSLFYSTVRRNGGQKLWAFSLSLFSHRDRPFMFSSSPAPFLHPIFSSYTPPHLSSLCIHIDWAEPSSPKKIGEECTRVQLFFFLFWKRDKKTRSSFPFLSHSLDNQVLAESSVRLKGACVEAESAGASAPRGHFGPFDSVQASLHLLTCP